MVIHEREPDQRGAGKWDLATTRYIPMQGGSRSRLPLSDDPAYHRYPGFVGIDERMTPDTASIPELYTYLGGASVVPAGAGSTLVKLILERSKEHLKQELEGAGKEKE